MAQAITTNVAPAVRRYTNIPGKVSEEPGGYKYHELGPKGQVIDDPEEFADIQSAQPTELEMSYFDYAAKIKSEMGDPYKIDVNQEATLMMQQQEAQIFERWSGGRVKYGGFMPKKQKREWGEYKQTVLSNAQKLAQDDKDKKIGEYEKKMAEFKTARGIAIERKREERLGKEGTEGQKIKGGLSTSQAFDQIGDFFVSTLDKKIAGRKFLEFMGDKEDSPAGRRTALQQTLSYMDRLDKGEISEEESDGLAAAHGKDFKYKPASQVTPPKGAFDTGRTKNGKKAYRLKNGNFWVQP